MLRHGPEAGEFRLAPERVKGGPEIWLKTLPTLRHGKGGKGTNLSGGCLINTLYDMISFNP